MTTARQLQILKSVDDLGEVLPARIDVVRAAVLLVEAWEAQDDSDWFRIAAIQNELSRVVHRYKAACRRRGKLSGIQAR